MDKSRNTGEAGITLVELLVAIVILTIVLGGLAQSIVGALQATVRQEARIQGTATANALLEDIRVIDFDRAAFCQSDFPVGSPTVVGGQELVLDAPGSATCNDADRLLPEDTVVRDGYEFTIERILTWVDSDADGLGLADANGPRDLKRLQVSIEWFVRGELQSLSAETQRAPESGEQTVTADAQPRLVRIYDGRGGNETLVVAGRNKTSFDIILRSLEPLSNSVSATWTDRDDNPQTVPLLSVGGSPFEWRATIPTNITPGGGVQFENGETVFQITGTTDASTPEAVEDSVSVLFLHELEVLSGLVMSVGGNDGFPVEQTSDIWVDPDGVVCPFTLEVVTQGTLRNDGISLVWEDDLNDGDDRDPPDTAMAVDVVDSFGASFVTSYGIEDDFGPAEPSSQSGTDIRLVATLTNAYDPPIVLTEDYRVSDPTDAPFVGPQRVDVPAACAVVQ